ncbi:MAG: hypothetical protein OEN56_02310 [Gemmatimonadota bacterium]|nr:hypothetical protein [Gemmatimonadota bacterium]
MSRRALVHAAAILALAAPAQAQGPYAPVGLFIGKIEEGARIFTPARLLPLEHPEALGHDYPTVQQLQGTEFEALLWLGAHAGYQLGTTLQRYPREPSPTWSYREFRPPPDSVELGAVPVIRQPRGASGLPGLRAALYDGADLVLFIVDTRDLSLADRGMERSTAMGLDLSRAAFLTALDAVAKRAGGTGLRAIVFER